MMSKSLEIPSIAIFGIGEVGKSLAEAFLTHRHDIILVSRVGSSNSNIAQLREKGARAVEVDYSSHESIRKAVAGAHIVVSTLSGAAFAYQFSVAKAAKEEQVKLFVPSMWGFDYTNERFKDPTRNPPMIKEKFSLFESLDQLGTPWLAFSNGLFTSWMFSPEHGIDSKNRTVYWQGDGSKNLTFSHLGDVAEFVKLVLSNSFLSDADFNRWYFIESFRASFDHIFAEAQRLDSHPWTINRSSIDQAVRLQTEATDKGENAWHLSLIHDGKGLRDQNNNKEIDFTPKHSFEDSVKEVLAISRA